MADRLLIIRLSLNVPISLDRSQKNCSRRDFAVSTGEPRAMFLYSPSVICMDVPFTYSFKNSIASINCVGQVEEENENR